MSLSQTDGLLAQSLNNSSDTKDGYAKDLATGTDFKIDGVTVDADNLKAGHLFLLQQEMANMGIKESVEVEPSKQAREGLQGFIRKAFG